MPAARVLALLAATWIILLVAAPATLLGVPLSGLTYAFGSVICHQRPERSFHLAAAQLPVCARCVGLYVGAALGAIAALKSCASSSEAWRSSSGLRMGLVAAALPTAVTWGSEVMGLWSPANTTRFLAALPLGAAVALTVNYIECARPPRTGSRPRRTPI